MTERSGAGLPRELLQAAARSVGARAVRVTTDLPGLSTVLARLAEVLADFWPGSAPPEVYPAFGNRIPRQAGQPG